ncbi:hypothetical protein HQ35_08870 [Porphyromonas cangingivalis]|uniref:Uncharacterized protein n=1 Tax=Porphyromonas cangingivalis TaxID=36874 RepID=A0A0A2EQW4_PORCN|nr:hypothetical protein [Porphyromonas cangingivalis]KGN78754.1 hypothetical protein HQ35_08870 [Porphyromonas cangingivalis]
MRDKKKYIIAFFASIALAMVLTWFSETTIFGEDKDAVFAGVAFSMFFSLLVFLLPSDKRG